MDVQIEESWKQYLSPEFDKEYFRSLTDFVRKEYSSVACFPPGRLIFNAFNLCPFHSTKVVIIGQDPYHEPGQAHGLCFSVCDGVKFLLVETLPAGRSKACCFSMPPLRCVLIRQEATSVRAGNSSPTPPSAHCHIIAAILFSYYGAVMLRVRRNLLTPVVTAYCVLSIHHHYPPIVVSSAIVISVVPTTILSAMV